MIFFLNLYFMFYADFTWRYIVDVKNLTFTLYCGGVCWQKEIKALLVW